MPSLDRITPPNIATLSPPRPMAWQYQIPVASSIGTASMERLWDQQWRLNNMTIGQLHAANIGSPIRGLDANDYLRTFSLTTGRSLLTFGVRPLLMGLSIAGVGGPWNSIGGSVTSGLEGLLDRYNDPLVSAQLQAGSRGIGLLENVVGGFALGRDLAQRIEPYPVVTDLERSGQLNWVARPITTTRWSVDWPGVRRDLYEYGRGKLIGTVGTGVGSALRGPGGGYSATHIGASYVSGTLPSLGLGIAQFDSMRVVVTRMESTLPAIRSDWMSGYDPTTDTMSTTRLERTRVREITLPSSQLAAWRDWSWANTYRSWMSPELSWMSLNSLPSLNSLQMPPYQFNTPSWSMPSYTLPSFTMPSFTLPSFTMPSFTLPKISVPTLPPPPPIHIPTYDDW